MDSGRGKIFRSLYFWLFRGALFPVRLFSSISGISIFASLSGILILFNGTCLAKTAPEKFCGPSMFGFLSVLAFVRRWFRDIWWLVFLSVRFGSLSRAFPLRLSLFLLFSSPRLSPLGGRPGRGPPPVLRFFLDLLRSSVPPMEAGAVT